MQKVYSGQRKTIAHVQTESSQPLPFSERFKGKINHVSKIGLNDILLRSNKNDEEIHLFRSKID